MTFNKPETRKFRGHDIRSFTIEGKDWIVSYDIVDAIEYRETSRWSIGRKMRAKVDPAEKGVYPIQTEHGSRAPIIVTVAGARQMIAGSRQPLAAAFCTWLDETFSQSPPFSPATAISSTSAGIT
ncbi:BRO family protein [Bosea sp. NPDC003192]|uniref:BRO family protein n=1 Tax=Bosea sp. NPDC003192 TaxID=3390551 RepID=UPI003CFBE9A5